LFRVFLNRHGGSQILWWLLAECGIDNTRAVVVSAASLGRRFGISRMHVSRLLRDAEAEQLLRRNDAGALSFTSTAFSALRVFYAWQIGLLLVSVARTRHQLRQRNTSTNYLSNGWRAMQTDCDQGLQFIAI
jgi:hypothetical protein